MPRLTEKNIIRRVSETLTELGCPNVRPAEGSEEWNQICGSYTKTPDLAAGPLYGNGSPQDFLIDVFSPKGDQYFKTQAGAPSAAATVKKAMNTNGSFSPRDLGSEYGPFLNPLNAKVAKYSGTRNNTPMLGLVMYFCITNNDYAGPLLAHMHSHTAIDDAFALTSGSSCKQIVAALNRSFGPGDTETIIIANLRTSLSFLMIHADKELNGEWNKKTLLLVNSEVTRSEFTYKNHPVIKWLSNLAANSILHSSS